MCARRRVCVCVLGEEGRAFQSLSGTADSLFPGTLGSLPQPRVLPPAPPQYLQILLPIPSKCYFSQMLGTSNTFLPRLISTGCLPSVPLLCLQNPLCTGPTHLYGQIPLLSSSSPSLTLERKSDPISPPANLRGSFHEHQLLPMFYRD